MGGSGSGNWYRWDKKELVENYRSLDVNRWVREGVIKEGYAGYGGWVWYRDAEKKEQTASIGYLVKADISSPYVRLCYTANETEKIDYRIPLTRTFPPFGGIRWWFVCPRSGCGRRVGKLYGGQYFLCRHCQDLRYKIQREADHSRLMTEAQKIRIRLGGSASLSGPFPWKPEGMHWRTYLRLRPKALIAENESWKRTELRFGLKESDF
jgi:hypothetical protein